jgi:DNA repair protein RecO (recombination protein O)
VDLADWRFYWRWLKSWGLAPDLERCQGCGVELEGALFCGESLFCGRCSGGRYGVELSPRERSELFTALNLSYSEMLAIKVQPGIDPGKVVSCTRQLARTLSDRS